MPNTKWHRSGNRVYSLQHAGWRDGVEQFEHTGLYEVKNEERTELREFSVLVEPGSWRSLAEAEAIAESIQLHLNRMHAALQLHLNRMHAALSKEGEK